MTNPAPYDMKPVPFDRHKIQPSRPSPVPQPVNPKGCALPLSADGDAKQFALLVYSGSDDASRQIRIYQFIAEKTFVTVVQEPEQKKRVAYFQDNTTLLAEYPKSAAKVAMIADYFEMHDELKHTPAYRREFAVNHTVI